MKKAMIFGVILAMLVVALAGCAQEQAPETEPEAETAVQEEAPKEQEQEPEQDAEPVQLSAQKPADSDAVEAAEAEAAEEVADVLQGEALHAYFQQVYDIAKDGTGNFSFDGYTDEDYISMELAGLEENVAKNGDTLPGDYEAQYRAWRPTTPAQPAAPSNGDTGGASNGDSALLQQQQPVQQQPISNGSEFTPIEEAFQNGGVIDGSQLYISNTPGDFDGLTIGGGS